jgi:hypothetical protein
MWEVIIGTLFLRLVAPDMTVELAVPDKDRLHMYRLNAFYKNLCYSVEIDAKAVEQYRLSACVQMAEAKAAEIIHRLHAADLEATPTQGSA